MEKLTETQVAARFENADWWINRCNELHRAECLRNAQAAREVRRTAGLSLRSVARQMGISTMYLSDLERGNRQWSGDTATQWASAVSAARCAKS